VQSLESTLYELGAATGDLLTIVPDGSTESNLMLPPYFAHVFRDSGDTLEVSDHVPLMQILPLLPQHRGPKKATALISTSTTRNVLFGRPVMDLRQTAEQIGLHPGDTLSLVEVRLQSSRVTLVLSAPRGDHQAFKINFSPAVLGRFDKNLADKRLDIDLSRVLRRGKERSVSRRQAEFTEENGVWRVQLHKDARVPMFVDNQRLTMGEPIALSENNVLSFGNSPNHPDFQLVVGLETD